MAFCRSYQVTEPKGISAERGTKSVHEEQVPQSESDLCGRSATGRYLCKVPDGHLRTDEQSELRDGIGELVLAAEDVDY
ncbi:Hypothetical protein NTJ_10597 [Nesidiocoris tenuis]|uniref:Uncharacterized protein n=1 Tax=Nesidiocoris tenuis TaxID=355587 RepID=A0ABN7B029_9HEMI|nr:Hypothetical protein NTJ_10597 [Nesidiocoris tenuis]